MPINVHTAVLIIGIVFILAAVLMSIFVRFGRTAPLRARRFPRVGLMLVGVALILWALMTRPAPVLQRDQIIVSGGAVGSPASTAPAATATSPAAAASGAAGTTPPPSQPAQVAHPDVLFVAGAAFENCAAPAAPGDPPDGATATRQQMLAAQARAKAFDAATSSYLRCLKTAADNFNKRYARVLTAPSIRDVDGLRTRINNSAVDTDQALADKFNQQLRIFKARKGS